MVFGLFILNVIGFYLLYANSAKTNHVFKKWEEQIRKKKKASLSFGGFLFGVTLVASVFLFGFAGGLFYDITSLMLVASLTILFRPLFTKEQSKTDAHASK